ncbi:MAG TPA: PEGA domain-containing protein [Polyangia bacterium]
MRRPQFRFTLAVAAALAAAMGALASGQPTAWAQTPAAAPKRAEARARFDRAMALLKEHDEAGALAEFQLTYNLVPAPQTLLLIGVLSANLNRPVESVKALDVVLAAPGPLSAQQLGIAHQRRDEQALKVGFLHVLTSAPATIQVDAVDLAITPNDKPIAVAAGTRLVTALSSGYLPTRKEVTVAGGITAEITFDLVPSERRAAHLFVRASLVDADVLVDGERVGRTPLAGSITIQPGDRLVEVRRAGDNTASSKIAIGDGATAELAFAPTENTGDGSARGTLAVEASEPEAELVVDGGARGVYRAPVALPAGRHMVRVVRGGFVPSERLLAIPENAEARVHVTLTPTPETRDAYVAHARSVRHWGWLSTAAGVAIGGAGGVALAILVPKLSQARKDRDALLVTFNPGAHCDQAGANYRSPECAPKLQAANDLADGRATKVNISIAVTSLGGAALLTGLYLLVTGDDPARYDNPPSDDSAIHPLLGFSAAVDNHGGGFTLVGHF